MRNNRGLENSTPRFYFGSEIHLGRKSFFFGKIQRLCADCQNSHVGTGLQNRLDELRAGAEEVVAMGENEQEIFFAQICKQRNG